MVETMSHWTKATIKLRNPNREILKQAIAVLAQELANQYDFVEARVIENAEITGWQGRQRVDFAIPAALSYGNGIGIRITDDGFEVVADVEGTPLYGKLSELAQKLQQYYIAIAIAAAAKQLGWTVSNVQQTENAVVIDVMTPA